LHWHPIWNKLVQSFASIVLLGYEIIHDTSTVLFLRCTFDWVVVVCRIQQTYNQSISVSRVFLSGTALARSSPGPPDSPTQGKPKGEVIQCTYDFLLFQPEGADVFLSASQSEPTFFQPEWADGQKVKREGAASRRADSPAKRD
jgi:hypothetical protein